ncbi:MAG: hypothetical protein HY711_01185 [Candidatus Melainabacteria bacterium]|nr:hypothetical protein [Candidatus Melainabacteria bacterium]
MKVKQYLLRGISPRFETIWGSPHTYRLSLPKGTVVLGVTSGFKCPNVVVMEPETDTMEQWVFHVVILSSRYEVNTVKVQDNLEPVGIYHDGEHTVAVLVEKLG